MEFPGPMPPSGTSCYSMLCYAMLSCLHTYVGEYSSCGCAISLGIFMYLSFFIPYVSCLIVH